MAPKLKRYGISLSVMASVMQADAAAANEMSLNLMDALLAREAAVARKEAHVQTTGYIDDSFVH